MAARWGQPVRGSFGNLVLGESLMKAIGESKKRGEEERRGKTFQEPFPLLHSWIQAK